jgi:hypothetical protein
LEEIIVENFKNSKNNTICVKLAKVLKYYLVLGPHILEMPHLELYLTLNFLTRI